MLSTKRGTTLCDAEQLFHSLPSLPVAAVTGFGESSTFAHRQDAPTRAQPTTTFAAYFSGYWHTPRTRG